MLTAGLISAVIGEQLPGHGTVYLKQDMVFLAPVRPENHIGVGRHDDPSPLGDFPFQLADVLADGRACLQHLLPEIHVHHFIMIQLEQLRVPAFQWHRFGKRGASPAPVEPGEGAQGNIVTDAGVVKVLVGDAALAGIYGIVTTVILAVRGRRIARLEPKAFAPFGAHTRALTVLPPPAGEVEGPGRTAGAPQRRPARPRAVRRATAADTGQIAAFHADMHRDPGVEEPEAGVAAWVCDLMGSDHPTMGPADFTVVEDQRAGTIVSSLCLISQTWTYAGIAFGVGRPELVGTHPDYRNRGLIRAHGMSSKTVAGGLRCVDELDLVMATCNLDYNEELAVLEAMGTGILVTGFVGGNSNPATGDFSFGIRGRWVEGGRPVRAVSEMKSRAKSSESCRRLGRTSQPTTKYSPWQADGICCRTHSSDTET